jgi:NodT family efflux transporter outer membrane factor (OMF) lipoprotein
MKRMTFLKTKTYVASALLGLAVTGCAVGPDYVAPEPALTAFHNTAAAPNSQSRQRPSLDQWWLAFDDPMLVQVVQRALAQNLDLVASVARVQQARAAAAGAGADLLPTVDFGGSATAEHQSTLSPTGKLASSLPGYSRTSHEYTLGPSASWEIDLFGGLRRDATAAREEAQAAEADQAGVRISVAADAADAYQIETDRRLLQLVRDRYNAGSATGREVAQADALLKRALATVPPLRIGLEKQLNRLDVLMGVQPGTYASELGTPHDVPAVPPIPRDNSPTDMLRRRPDVIAAERRLAASNEHIGAAISDYYPKISLSGALGLDSVGTNRMFSASAFQAVGGGALRWRLFDFGKVDAEVKQAKGANAEALAIYRQSVLHAAEDVENALVTLSQTQIRLAEIQDQIEALTKARDLSQQAYRAGSITLTDVLDADSQLLSARDELDSNRADAARAAVGVYRALGGGWEPATHNLTASR